MLKKEQGRLLTKLARDALRREVKIHNKEFLKKKRGVFVTLVKKGELRGCIGYPYPIKPLGQAVVEAARSAGFKDPRFPPVKEGELDEISVEVSVLTKPEKCKLEEIKKGDGVILEKNNQTALFLPQVWEELEDKESFLQHLSVKARLSPSDYLTASYKRFKVQCFK